jgi:tetratricopeptide (TPR) repeat protein
MNLRIFPFLILLILFTSENSSGQSKRLERADAAFETGEYFLAIDLYKDAYNAVNDRNIRSEIIFKTAECYRKINDSRQAEVWYKKAINRNYSNPLVYLYYANALQMNEKFDDAVIEYQRYSELRPEDPRGRNGLFSCQLAREWMANPTAYQVSEMQFLIPGRVTSARPLPEKIIRLFISPHHVRKLRAKIRTGQPERSSVIFLFRHRTDEVHGALLFHWVIQLTVFLMRVLHHCPETIPACTLQVVRLLEENQTDARFMSRNVAEINGADRSLFELLQIALLLHILHFT